MRKRILKKKRKRQFYETVLDDYLSEDGELILNLRCRYCPHVYYSTFVDLPERKTCEKCGDVLRLTGEGTRVDRAQAVMFRERHPRVIREKKDCSKKR